MRFGRLELANDVPPQQLRGGGGEHHEGHARQMITQLHALPILRTEIMPPQADTMRFIAGDSADISALQILDEARHHHVLHCGVEEFVMVLLETGVTPLRLAA